MFRIHATTQVFHRPQGPWSFGFLLRDVSDENKIQNLCLTVPSNELVHERWNHWLPLERCKFHVMSKHLGSKHPRLIQLLAGAGTKYLQVLLLEVEIESNANSCFIAWIEMLSSCQHELTRIHVARPFDSIPGSWISSHVRRYIVLSDIHMIHMICQTTSGVFVSQLGCLKMPKTTGGTSLANHLNHVFHPFFPRFQTSQ